MHLIQIFLPLYDNSGEKFPSDSYRQVRDELIDRFGGMTAYARSPVHGLWQPEEGKTLQDDLVIYEVMVKEMNRPWWKNYKSSLGQRFRQEEILIRAQPIELFE